MSSRRSFIKKSILAVGGLYLLGPEQIFASSDRKLTILHTNDMHSRIEPFSSGKYAGMGGMSRRAAIIKKIRSEEKNILLLDAGDIFQGTPYYNYYKGEPEIKLMSQMRYDAVTLGNHDFDYGLEGIANQMPNASFPYIISNYDFSDTILKDRTIPYKIFIKDKIKIGVFGLGIELKGLVPDQLYGRTVYKDPISSAQIMVSKLKKENCSLIICLSHLGYKYSNEKVSDQILARDVEGIDLIIGGHTHTFLESPLKVINKAGKECIINQVGFGGINLGRIDFYFGSSSNKVKEVHTSLIELKPVS